MIKSRQLPLALAAALLAGCQTQPPKMQLPSPLPVAGNDHAQATLNIKPLQPGRTDTGVSVTPVPPNRAGGAAGLGQKESLPPLEGPPITANLSNLPLPAFLNAAYGNMLHVNYVLDPHLAKQTDLVTLRVTDPQTPEAFYRIVSQVLLRYGIAGVWDGHALNLMPVKDASGSEPPILISGRALPDVPESHRPIFQLVELRAVSNGDVARWLRTAYNSDQLKIDEDINRNAVVLSGPPELVQQAVQAISVLDRPYLRGTHSRRIEPAFIAADQLAPRIVDSLRAEGYAASVQVTPSSSIIILPVAAANSLLVFAPDEAMLDHVVQWALAIDRPNPASNKDSLFYYPVANTKAADIASVLNGGRNQNSSNLSMGSNNPSAGSADATKTGTGSTNSTNSTNKNGGISGDQGVLMVDEPRNALIYRGDPAEWQRLLPLVQQMDRAARQVMIEVTIAEVTLDDDTEYGVSWLAKDSHGKYDGSWQLGTLNGTAPGASGGTNGTNGDNLGNYGGTGLTYLIDVAGTNRAKLTALASNQRVTILSTPRLLVKSGDEASIDVGTEIPTLSSQTASSQQSQGNSNILQSIQYRKTGIILDVKPTIYSDNRIDLDISQEVSEAQAATASSGVNSPSIFNRVVKTSLSLMDGGSVVLGGLVSNKESLGDGGIPLLKDIPVVGNLFRSHSKQKTRTELLLVIVPYIIESDQQAKVVTRAVIDSMQTMDATKLTTPLVPAAAPAADGRSPSIPAANPPAPPPAPGTAAPTQGATAPSDRRNVPSNN